MANQSPANSPWFGCFLMLCPSRFQLPLVMLMCRIFRNNTCRMYMSATIDHGSARFVHATEGMSMSCNMQVDLRLEPVVEGKALHRLRTLPRYSTSLGRRYTWYICWVPLSSKQTRKFFLARVTNGIVWLHDPPYQRELPVIIRVWYLRSSATRLAIEQPASPQLNPTMFQGQQHQA